MKKSLLAIALLFLPQLLSAQKARLFDQVQARGVLFGGVYQAGQVGALYYTLDTSGNIGRLVAGLQGQYLTMGGSAVPTWGSIDLAGSYVSGILGPTRGGLGLGAFTKGQLFVAINATTLAALNVGTNGQLLGADDAAIGGVRWMSPSGGAPHTLLSHSDANAAVVARGDLVVGFGETPLWTRLGIGTAGYLLLSNGTDPNWGQLDLAGAGVTGLLGLGKGGLGADASAATGFPEASGGSFTFRLKTGTGAKLASATAAGASGNCASWTAAGDIGDAGAACGSGSGSTPFQASITPDRNPTLGTMYRRNPNTPSIVELKPQVTWLQDIADAKTNTPAGWTWANSGNVASAVTSGGVLRVVHAATTSNWQSPTLTSPQLYKVLQPGSPYSEIVARIRILTAEQSASKFASLIMVDTVDLSLFARLDVNPPATLYFFDSTNAGQSTTATVTATQINDGIWFKLTRNGEFVTASYSVANQATPPTSWTHFHANMTHTFDTFQRTDSNVRVGFNLILTNSGANGAAEMLYFDDTLSPASQTFAEARCATGCDDSGAQLSIVTSWDLGAAGATISDADIQAAAIEATNPRASDTASVLWGAARGASPSPTCTASASASTYTVSGTGQYLSWCVKVDGDTTRSQQGAIDWSKLTAPYRPTP